MFTLNEELYNTIKEDILLDESLTSLDSILEDIEESQKEAEASFDLLEAYTRLSLNEIVTAASNVGPGTGKENENEHEKPSKKESAMDNKSIDGITNSIIFGMKDPTTDANLEYKPLVGKVEVTKLSEMKFPDNIIFFISQVVNFIKNVIIKFFKIIRNAIRGLLGMTQKEKVTFDDLELKLQKSKELQTMGLPVLGKASGPLELKTVDAGLINKLFPIFESAGLNEDSVWARNKDEYPENNVSKKQVSVISIDISKELNELEEFLEHFFELFDNAFGSNNEHLFSTEDLQLLLDLFRDTINRISHGIAPTYEVSGKMAEVQAIDSGRVKDNLLRTKVNVDNLKEAFTLTEKKIQIILEMIMHKQVIGSSQLGVAFKYYSASSYEVMIRILKAIGPKLKNAKAMEKAMEKMQDRFDRVVAHLNEQRASLTAFGNITYSTIYQRRINDLFDSARMVSQTITLRLTALSMYVKELTDLKMAIINANAVNTQGGAFSKAVNKWAIKKITRK